MVNITERRANYHVSYSDDKSVVIIDDGPWDEYLTVTNAVEHVTKDLFKVLEGRQLFCIDSEGNQDELLYDSVDGTFKGFAAI